MDDKTINMILAGKVWIPDQLKDPLIGLDIASGPDKGCAVYGRYEDGTLVITEIVEL